MKSVGSGAGDGIDDAPGGLAVLGGEVVGEHRKLCNGIHAEVAAENRPGARVRVVVDADAVEPIVVLRRAPARHRDLLTETAIAAPGTLIEADLRRNQSNPGLEGRQIGPAATIDRKVADDWAFHGSAECRGGEVD